MHHRPPPTPDRTRQAVGDALGEIRKQLRSEFQEQLGLIRADLAIHSAHDAGSEIIDLPMVPLRGARRA
jgi:hypothetical protein